MQIIGCLIKDPSLLLDPKVYIDEQLDFTEKMHKLVYGAIYNLFNSNTGKITPIDIDNYLSTYSVNYEYYKKPEIYCNAIDAINLKIVNKSHLQFNINKSKELLSEEGNDLYLCYLIMWSLTLWYTDEWERELRFLQMIEIIEKVQGHDIQIFEILFKALVDVKWSDKDIILLYKKFIHLNLNPTWKIFSLVSKIIKKKANIKNKKELLSQLTKFEQLKIKNKEKSQKNAEENINFRSRTLKVKSVDDKILSEDVIFYAYGYCNGCSKNINLINLCSNLSQLKTKTVLLKNNSVPSKY